MAAAPAPADALADASAPTGAGRFAWRSLATFALLAAAAALLYWWTGPKPVGLDAFVPLADALLHGRLHIVEPMPWIEHVDRAGGGWYVPYPPMPAISVRPFVLVFGPTFDQGYAAAIMGGLCVALLWAILGWLGVAPMPRRSLTAAFAIGSVLWWAAGIGTSWLFAGVNGVFWSLLALWLALDRRWPVVAGVCLGFAAASRLPVGLTLPLYLALYAGLELKPRVTIPDRRRLWDAGRFLLGLAVPAILVALYNVARFGSPIDFGYEKIPGVLQEPWYREGILSLSYIPRHLHTIFLRGFDFADGYPWFRPNWTGLALTFTTPIYFWLVQLRRRETFVVVGWLAILLALLPIVTHGNVGETQFGYRFSLDVAPILWIMLGMLFLRRISVPARLAILAGIVVHAYGIYVITVLDFVSY
jgi:hypothetical protein